MSVMSQAAPAREFAFIAGHVALDVLNTVAWRLNPVQRKEDLTAYQHVLAWAALAQLISEEERQELARLAKTQPQQAAAELKAFRAARETAYAALVERDEGAVEEVVAQHRRVLCRSRLALAGDHWHWTEPELALTIPRDRMVRAVVELLTSPDLAALHQCEDVACGWVYLDSSPRRNRRWCVAADCGNRNRARRFYARQKEKAAQTPVES
jgi:predicted RNA-binding Zn ribbon-like protein